MSLDRDAILGHILKDRDTLQAELDQAHAALARVEALAEKWRYKGEFGWGHWQEGYGPDHEGEVLDHAAAELRTAITGILETPKEDQ